MQRGFRVLARRRAAAANQYALIVGLIAVVALSAVVALGGGLSSILNKAALLIGGTSGVTSNSSGSAPPAPPTPRAAYAWGRNDSGAAGVGNSNQLHSPTAVPGGQTFLQLAPSGTFGCGIIGDGTPYCWGAGYPSLTPAALSTAQRFSQIASGQSHACGLSGGSLYCWGSNQYGQYGNGTTTSTGTTPSAGSGLSFTQISAASDYTCGLVGGAAYCFGNDGYGAAVFTHSTPVAVPGSHVFTSITSGEQTSCGIASDGTWCWGANANGNLGNGSVDGSWSIHQPEKVVGNHNFSKVVAGSAHNCGIEGGQVYCWGWNAYGQVGSSGSPVSTPALLNTTPGGQSLTGFTDLALGAAFSCGISSGRAYCWGFDVQGQLGDGDGVGSFVGGATNQPTPIADGPSGQLAPAAIYSSPGGQSSFVLQ